MKTIKETTSVERYFSQRMALLGITNEMLRIELYTDSFQNTDYHKHLNIQKEYQIFQPNEKGIGILLYSILGEVQWFRTIEGKQKTTEYRQTRLLHRRNC